MRVAGSFRPARPTLAPTHTVLVHESSSSLGNSPYEATIGGSHASEAVAQQHPVRPPSTPSSHRYVSPMGRASSVAIEWDQMTVGAGADRVGWGFFVGAASGCERVNEEELRELGRSLGSAEEFRVGSGCLGTCGYLASWRVGCRVVEGQLSPRLALTRTEAEAAALRAGLSLLAHMYLHLWNCSDANLPRPPTRERTPLTFSLRSHSVLPFPAPDHPPIHIDLSSPFRPLSLRTTTVPQDSPRRKDQVQGLSRRRARGGRRGGPLHHPRSRS